MMIKYFIMDVDGTLTDGKVYIGSNGEIMKAFNIKDGYGIHDILIPRGITPIVITGRESIIVQNRCKELGIHNVYQGVDNKLKLLYQITSSFSEIAYIGDDMNDFDCMKLIKSHGGVIACPKDAVKQVSSIVDYVTPSIGGNGAVRDFIDWLLPS